MPEANNPTTDSGTQVPKPLVQPGDPQVIRFRGRSGQKIVDEAIVENRIATWLLYFFAAILVAAGTIALLVGVFGEEPLTAFVGALSDALFIPAMYFARQIREDNINLRLLEAPLTWSETPMVHSQSPLSQAAAEKIISGEDALSLVTISDLDQSKVSSGPYSLQKSTRKERTYKRDS